MRMIGAVDSRIRAIRFLAGWHEKCVNQIFSFVLCIRVVRICVCVCESFVYLYYVYVI